ncbi:thioredoxin-like protein [Entophlyctis helioformis]|nr:thioredoxin-like protein [Entophlyctis helioformis]
MSARVQIYYSSVSGMTKIKKAQTRIEDLLAAFKLPYELIDIAADEDAKAYMQAKSGKAVIPQIFVDGEYKGTCEELDEANENGEGRQWLGL